MAEPITSTKTVSEDRAPTSEAELRAELARSREEVLRLRDLLIARDAELGSLKGKVAQLEAGTARLLNLAQRVRALVPGLVWQVAAAARRALGRG